MIVVDASVLANALADDRDSGDAARERLAADAILNAPHLVDLEVLSVLRKRANAGDLDERRVALAIADLSDLAITRFPHVPFARRVWDLRHNFTPYDAVYVALAETLRCALVTADERLGAAPGPRCEVEMLTLED